MIRYSLICANEHEFEGWFRDSRAYEHQLASGDIGCPICGSTEVSKALMAPAVSVSREQSPASVPMASTGDPRRREMLETLRRLKRHVMENSEYVGERFPEEARKIHYAESEVRSIHGEASLEEAKRLLEEGVEVHPLPILPDESN